jgi:hypothetical protein
MNNVKYIPPGSALPPSVAKFFRKFLVHASILDVCYLSELPQDDWQAFGLYEVLAPRVLELERAACYALGAFHSTVPIHRLDLFYFVVWDICESSDYCGGVRLAGRLSWRSGRQGLFKPRSVVHNSGSHFDHRASVTC